MSDRGNMRKSATDMVYIGQEKLKQLVKHTGLSTRELSTQLEITTGGLYYITHKSGKMDIKDWRKFKQIYKRETGEFPNVDESEFDAQSRKDNFKREQINRRLKRSKEFNLKNVETKQLIAELEKRGYSVSLND